MNTVPNLDGASSAMGASIQAPARVVLPRVGALGRARRLGTTVRAAGRHVAPVAARSLLRRPQVGTPLAHATRRTFEELGATYVKFGQFVASAPAVFGSAVADVFRDCLDGAPPVPFAAVRAAVEAELRQPLGTAFASFDARPLAAASLAVVHRAKLPDGTPVVVKVLRPRIEHQVAADLALMQPAMRALAWQGVEPAGNAYTYLVGLNEQIREELDLRNEAHAMSAFRTLFERGGLASLVIPRVYEQLTTGRVLTMEYLDGVPIDDLSAIERLGHDPRPLLRQLVGAWVLTGACDGAFHADIHAGNLLLLRDGRLGMLDWGIVARLDADTHRLFRRLLEASIGVESAWDDIYAHAREVMGRALRDGVGLTDPEIDRLVRALMEPLLTQPVGQVSMATLFGSFDDMVERATGRAIPKRTRGERWAIFRRTRRALRLEIEQGYAQTEFRRANFLAAKQLVYLERYWRMYLPDEPLLADHAFIRNALAGALPQAATTEMAGRDEWAPAAP